MNLLQETLEVLKNNELTPDDVYWVGTDKAHTSWENFAKVADVTYDAGFGGQEVATDLIIVGQNWWMERHEYDGSEWWEFKQLPQKPQNETKIIRVVGGCWSELEEINKNN